MRRRLLFLLFLFVFAAVTTAVARADGLSPEEERERDRVQAVSTAPPDVEPLTPPACCELHGPRPPKPPCCSASSCQPRHECKASNPDCDCSSVWPPKYSKQPRGTRERASTGYNGEFVFAASRELIDSPAHPALKAFGFILTVPVDLALLPFALIGGLAG